MINFKKIKEISKALEPANRNGQRCFHTTFLVKKNRIVSIGWNQIKSHPRNLQYDYKGRDGNHLGHSVKTHSELRCILNYGEDDCSDCHVINVRINMNGEFSTAAPCRGCAHLLKQIGFKSLWSTNKNGEFEKLA